MQLIKPKIAPPLDGQFRPPVLANRHFRETAQQAGSTRLIIGLEQADGSVSRYETPILPEDHPQTQDNIRYVERLVKFLLWQRGGCKVYIGGSEAVGQAIAQAYSPQGARAFDYHFMGEKVYQQPFEVVVCAPEAVPAEVQRSQPLGRHLEGSRIGFDLGASDLKISAVVDGEAIFSDEIVWEPVQQSDPDYHYSRIKAALELAASKLEHVDAIGGSSAGVYVNNRAMVASLFRGIPEDQFHKVRDMFLRIREEMGVPLEIINDGEVTALAGAMSLQENGILGIAMGSSEAAGYVTPAGNITNWLNELAFAPVDYNPAAAVDEWSGDAGVGALYFSQQAVFRLAPLVSIAIPQDLTNAEKLKIVQKELEAGHEGAVQIWQTMGVYLGYTLAHYADFYDLRHVLILGRCTSGSGGPIMLEYAQNVLKAEFPDLAANINLQLPDEKSRRVGQSIAAASLPAL